MGIQMGTLGRATARLLVSEDEYRCAERLVGHEVGALARELDVTHRLVIAWRRCHKAA